jgi:hypothetical protein
MQQITTKELIQYSKKLEESISNTKKAIIQSIKCCKIIVEIYSTGFEKEDITIIDKNRINKDYVNYYLRFINSYSTKIPIPSMKNQIKIIEDCNSTIVLINDMEKMISNHINEINKIKLGVYN